VLDTKKTAAINIREALLVIDSLCLSLTNAFLMVRGFFPYVGFWQIFSIHTVYCKSHQEIIIQRCPFCVLNEPKTIGACSAFEICKLFDKLQCDMKRINTSNHNTRPRAHVDIIF
jgi:hypothetical protein